MRDFYVRPFTVNINPFLINVPLLYPLKTKAKAENIFSKKQFFCEDFSISIFEWEINFCLVKLDKVFKNEPSKMFGRQPLKNFTCSILEYFVANVLNQICALLVESLTGKFQVEIFI